MVTDVQNTVRQIRDQDVYDLISQIPAGKVTTYGDIAKALGVPQNSRRVGRILGRNPNPITVPCHRVVMSDSSLGGYSNPLASKQSLLEKEGITFVRGSVKDFKKARFDFKL